MSNFQNLERMCTTLLDSLLASKDKHTLCLNLAEKGFEAELFVKTQLAAKGQSDVSLDREPTTAAFRALTSGLEPGKVAIVQFNDLDKHPACIDLLLEHVKKTTAGGKLVVVSREWNSDNTAKEQELRRHCLFYQQAAPAKTPSKRP